jgi:predicted branched-subunit amino acid permease
VSIATEPVTEDPTAGRRGLADAATMLLAIAPLGVALGATAGETDLPPLLVLLTAPLMVAGAAQLVLVAELDHGASAVTAAVAAILLNARFVVYGAALATRFRSQPRWFRLIAPHYVVDQTYAMVSRAVSRDASDRWFRRYLTSAGTVLWIGWTASFGIGIVAGPLLPSGLWLDAILPLTFAAMITPQLRQATHVAAVTAGGALVAIGWSTTGTIAAAAVVGGMLGAGSHREGTS